MILENMDFVLLFLGMAMTFVFCLLLVIFGSGPAFAWNDRWIDRTRNKISDKVESEE
ncbi:MAG: hypothetical protein IKY77_04045 [Methanocorpusculaceae archaeon]|nr:hypothetical protein [Methanocorpusculaceae archaeon]